MTTGEMTVGEVRVNDTARALQNLLELHFENEAAWQQARATIGSRHDDDVETAAHAAMMAALESAFCEVFTVTFPEVEQPTGINVNGSPS